MHDEGKMKKATFGTGLLKGLGITMRHMVSKSVTVQYPDEIAPLPPRSRGVIALKEENCTVCNDALFWSPEFEYAEGDITRLTHEKERLEDWMSTVLPPSPLDDGAKGPELKIAAPVAVAPPPVAEAVAAAPAALRPAPVETEPAPPVPAPAKPAVAVGGMSDADAAEVRRKVYEVEMAKGSDPRIAEARSKAAEMRAKKGTLGPGG